MAMKYLKVWYDWPETTEYLTAAQKGTLIDALVKYARGDADAASSLKGAALALFPAFKRQIDQDTEQYAAQTERNRENGKKGGRPRKEAEETQENPENPVGFSETQVVFQKTQKSQEKRIKNKDKEEDEEEDKDLISEKKDFYNGDNKEELYAPARVLSVRESRYLSTCTVRSVEQARESLGLPNDNWLTSERARKATAQLVADAIVRDARWAHDPRYTDGLYDTVLGVLEDRLLSPLTIYMMAVQSGERTRFFNRLSGVIV